MSDDAMETTVDPGGIVHDVITSALQAATMAGIDRKHFLSGLWFAAISTVLHEAEVAVLIDVLEDKIILTKGVGTNAECSLQDLSPQERKIRHEEVSRVAEIVFVYAEPMIEQLDSDEVDAIDAFLSAVLGILREKWGPTHLRRILKDQINALKDGVESPIAPTEPSTPNRGKDRSASRTRPPAPTPADSSPKNGAPAAKLQYGAAKGRKVEIALQAEIVGAGSGIFAVAMRIFHDDDVLEHREISGAQSGDKIGRHTLLKACSIALSTLGAPAADETVTVYASSDFLINLTTAPAANFLKAAPAEKELIDAILLMTEGRNLNWTYRKPGLATDLAARCDRLVRTATREFLAS